MPRHALFGFKHWVRCQVPGSAAPRGAQSSVPASIVRSDSPGDNEKG